MNETSTSASPAPRGYDLLLLIMANAIWGSTDSIAKYALAEMSPITLTWLRFSVAAIFFLPPLYFRRREIPRSFRALLPFMALGACGFFLNFAVFYYGLRLAPASHATAFRVSEYLVILALSGVILGERVTRRSLLGIAAGLVGFIIVLDLDLSSLDVFTKGTRLGDALIFLGIVIEGLYTVIGKKTLANTRPLTATALACLFGWLMTTAASLPEIALLAKDPPSWKGMASAIYLGVFATAFAYWVWYKVLSRRESYRVGMTLMVQPAVGLPMAALFLGEKLDGWFLAGAVLIAAGVYVALSGAGSSAASPVESSSEKDG